MPIPPFCFLLEAIVDLVWLLLPPVGRFLDTLIFDYLFSTSCSFF
jgi:hypothetical protein